MTERSNWGGTLSDGRCPRCDRLTAERDAAEARAVKAEARVTPDSLLFNLCSCDTCARLDVLTYLMAGDDCPTCAERGRAERAEGKRDGLLPLVTAVSDWQRLCQCECSTCQALNSAFWDVVCQSDEETP
jgi:hypothetical protein